MFRNYPFIKLRDIVFAFLLFSITPIKINAQLLLPDTAKKTESKVEWPEDSLGRQSPRGSLNGFIRAVALKEYEKASHYLKLDSSTMDGLAIAKNLQYLLETSAKLLPSSRLSDEETGIIDDKLGPDFDFVGTATADGKEFSIVLERINDTISGPLWLFSSETIQNIPLLSKQNKKESVIENLSPKVLKQTLWSGVPVSHWLGMVSIIIISFLLALTFTRLLVYLIPLVWKKARVEPIHGIIQSFILPLRLYLTIWFFIVGSRWAGISIIVRQQFSDLALITGVIAFLLLIWQLMNYGSKYFEARMVRKKNFAGISAILFLRRAAKIALVILGVLVVLDTFGFNVTTWLAGLGIVGIALALGTQKTVENFVGSVTLIADQPVRVGDFCKAGDILGTIERIGMRTTSLRTNDRTVVTIPNGEFSSMKIENFTPRDRFLFNKNFILHITAEAEQLRHVLEGLRNVLKTHPKVNPDPARVRLVEIVPEGYKIEIFSYINTKDGNEYMEIQEELYLAMIDTINNAEVDFAMPIQQLHFIDDKNKTDEVKNKIE